MSGEASFSSFFVLNINPQRNIGKPLARKRHKIRDAVCLTLWADSAMLLMELDAMEKDKSSVAGKESRA